MKKQNIIKIKLVKNDKDKYHYWRYKQLYGGEKVVGGVEFEIDINNQEGDEIVDINGGVVKYKKEKMSSWDLYRIRSEVRKEERNKCKKRDGLKTPTELVIEYFGKDFGFRSFPGANSFWGNNGEKCVFGSYYNEGRLYILMFNISGGFHIYGMTQLKGILYGDAFTPLELENEVKDVENKFIWYNKDYYSQMLKKEVVDNL